MLPNVSAIYRDLAFMANPNTHQNAGNYNGQSSVHDVYLQKQARHNQLMEKLRNAQRESYSLNQELGGNNAYYPSSSNRGSFPSYQSSRQGVDYNQNAHFYTQESTSTSGRGWKPPNIRYRHIQDKKQAEISQPVINYPNQNRTKETLQKEFYENPQKESEELKESNKNEAISVNNMKMKDQENNIKLQEASESSYGRTWINRQSKFQDKLESYYDLCKKRPISRKIETRQPEHQTSKLRFTRAGDNRTSALELEKAMKLLSFD